MICAVAVHVPTVYWSQNLLHACTAFSSTIIPAKSTITFRRAARKCGWTSVFKCIWTKPKEISKARIGVFHLALTYAVTNWHPHLPGKIWAAWRNHLNSPHKLCLHKRSDLKVQLTSKVAYCALGCSITLCTCFFASRRTERSVRIKSQSFYALWSKVLFTNSVLIFYMLWSW